MYNLMYKEDGSLRNDDEHSEAVIQYISDKTGVVYSDEQMNILKHKGGMCILACAGSGKALANGTCVLTDHGYKPIETLSVGDRVFDECGCPQRVEGVYPQGDLDIWKIRFMSGEELEVSGDHLWGYYNFPYGEHMAVDTTETLYKLMYNGDRKVAAFGVPINKPVRFPDSYGNNYPKLVDPYIIGIIANDKYLLSYDSKDERGTQFYRNNARDVNFIDTLNTHLNKYGVELEFDGTTDSRIVDKDKMGFQKFKYELGMVDMLTSNGHKYHRIPNYYLYASIDDRRKLIKGLFDAEAEIRGNEYRLNLHNEKLAQDVQFILESLGYRGVKYKGYKNYACLTMPIYLGEEKPYSMSFFDTEIDYENVQAKPKYDLITSIEKTDKKKEMTCIKVTGVNELFLTEHCIVTHNTTVLTHLISKRILTGEISNPENLLCTTYSRAGADEMEERLGILLDKLGERRHVKVDTLHAICRQLLVSMGYPCKIIETSQKMRFIREACKAVDVAVTDEDVRLLESLFSYQINNLMSDEALTKSYVYTLKNVTTQQYSAIRQKFNQSKQADGVLDFDDMQLLLYSLFLNDTSGQLRAYCNHKWQHIYVDEAQDLSKIQFAMLKFFISDPKKLVFIGDDDQCIYQWRGADPSIILNVCGVYPDLTQFKLTTNYRCYGDVVRQAAVGIEFNRNRSKKTMTPANEGGEIRIIDVGGKHIYDMSKPAYNYIKDLVINKGVNPSEIAVLSRNNQHLTILSNMLFRDGIYCKTSDEMVFTKSNAYRLFREIIEFSENGTSGMLTGNVLWRLCPYMKRTTSNSIGNIQSSCGWKTSDVLGYILKKVGHCGDVNWDNNSVDGKALDVLKAQSIWSSIYGATTEVFKRVYEILCLDSQVKRASALMDMMIINKGNIFFNSHESMRFAEGVATYLTDLMVELGYEEFLRYMQVVTQYEYGKMAIITPMISMSTIHGAKGREWRHVIIFADDNVSFPSFDGINQCIKDGVSASDINSMIDESRRLHYVAMTRAKERLAIFTNSENPGVHMLESMGLMDYGRMNNQNIITMAQHGIYDQLVESGKQSLFDINSKYYMEVPK